MPANLNYLRSQSPDDPSPLHIVRIAYGGQDWHMAAKDINFSKGSIQWRWEQGYNDASRVITQAGWLNQVDDDVGVVVHEFEPDTPAPISRFG